MNYIIYENNTGHGSNGYNYYVHSLEVLVDIFTHLKSVGQAFKQVNNRKMSDRLNLQLFLKILGT